DAFDGAGTNLGHADSPATASSVVTYRVSQLAILAKGIRRIELDCDWRLILLEVGAKGAPSTAEVQATRAAMAETLERFKSEEPIFEQHKHYRLQVTTAIDEVSPGGGRSLGGAEIEQPAGANVQVSGSSISIVQDFEFKTEGPPGDVTLAPLGPGQDAVTGLDTLEPYVRRTL